jgi:hypothetical protein
VEHARTKVGHTTENSPATITVFIYSTSMPAIRCKLNHGFYSISSAKDRDYKHMPFLGFLASGSAKGMLGKTVRLNVWGYSNNEGPHWKQIEEDEYVLGFLTHSLTVFACLDKNGQVFVAKKDVLL